MGTWKRKGSSKPWFYKFEHGGKQYWKGGFASKGAALEAERQERVRLESQESLLSFEALVQARLAEMQVYCTRNHWRRAVTCLHRFTDIWGELYIGEINAPMIRSWVIKHAKLHSNVWVNKHLIFLKSVFNQAVRDNMLSKSPTVGIMKLPHEIKKKVIPEVSDIEAILSQAAPEEAAYLTTIWLTAARVREINNLTWDNVDLKSNTITLHTRKKSGGVKTPRVIPMVDKVRQAIEFMLAHRIKGSPYVFTNWSLVTKYPSDPNKWGYNYRSKFHSTLAKRAGVRKINYHELRHHTASYLLSQGVDLSVIQKILGHERATTTDIYLQSLPGAVKSGMEVLNQL